MDFGRPNMTCLIGSWALIAASLIWLLSTGTSRQVMIGRWYFVRYFSTSSTAAESKWL